MEPPQEPVRTPKGLVKQAALEGEDRFRTAVDMRAMAPHARAKMEAMLARTRNLTDILLQATDSFDVIERPMILIGGFPRTGTTALQSLLGGFPGAWTPKSWEVARPDLGSGGVMADVSSVLRARAALRAEFEGVRSRAPRLFDMHSLDVHGPEECTPWLAASFRSLFFVLSARCDAYAEWLLHRQTSLEPTYKLWASAVSRLVPPGARVTILKSPLHLIGYSELREAAPHALIVHVVRDFDDSMLSVLNLVHENHSLYDSPSPRETARWWLEWLPRVLEVASFEAEKNRAAIRLVAGEDLRSRPVESAIRLLGDDGLLATDVGEQRPVAVSLGHERQPARKYPLRPLRCFGLSVADVRASVSGIDVSLFFS